MIPSIWTWTFNIHLKICCPLDSAVKAIQVSSPQVSHYHPQLLCSSEKIFLLLLLFIFLLLEKIFQLLRLILLLLIINFIFLFFRGWRPEPWLWGFQVLLFLIKLPTRLLGLKDIMKMCSHN